MISIVNIYLLLLRIVILSIGLVPWVASMYCLNTGLSSLIDEGFMQLLMNRPKPLGPFGSQFAILVDTFTGNWAYNAATLMLARFILQSISVLILLVASIFYLERIIGQSFDIWIYSGFFMFVNGTCLDIFTKTISYNHVLQFTVYGVVSMCLVYTTFREKKLFRRLSLVLTGVLCSIAVLNILPSGLIIIACVIAYFMIQSLPDWDRISNEFLGLYTGFILGLLLFSLFVNELGIIFNEFLQIVSVKPKFNRSYDLNSLIIKFVRSVTSLLVVSLAAVGVAGVFNTLRSTSLPKIVPLLVPLFVCGLFCFFCIKYTEVAKIGPSELVIMPFAAGVYMFVNVRFQGIGRFQNWTTLCLLFIVPIVAPFGSNLPVTHKLFFFVGCWAIGIVMFTADLTRLQAGLIFGMFVLIVSIRYGQVLSKFEKNARESRSLSSKLVRVEGVRLTSKQLDHFESLYDVLSEHGFRQGDTILAFQPDLMSVFAVGGHSGTYVYFTPEDFLNKDIRTLIKPRFIMLNDFSYNRIRESLRYWGIDSNYEKIDIGSPETENYFDSDKPRMLFYLNAKPAK